MSCSKIYPNISKIALESRQYIIKIKLSATKLALCFNFEISLWLANQTKTSFCLLETKTFLQTEMPGSDDQLPPTHLPGWHDEQQVTKLSALVMSNPIKDQLTVEPFEWGNQLNEGLVDWGSWETRKKFTQKKNHP